MSPTGAEGLLRSLLDCITDPCLVLDEEATITHANASARRLYGADPVGLDWQNLCADPVASAALAEHACSCEADTLTLETRCRKPDGSLFHGELTARRWDAPSRALTMLVVRELTERLERCADELSVAQILLDETSDSIFANTVDGTLLHANRAALECWEADQESLAVTEPWGWLPESHRSAIASRSADLPESGECRYDFETVDPHGLRRAFEVHSRLVSGPLGEMIVSSARDVSERLESEEMVRYLAYHDTLTGLANRVLLDQELADAIKSSDRYGDVVGVVFLDLDDFKPVNDTYGHAIGDHVLRKVADRIAGAVRDTDTVARLGGDEFVALLPRLSSPYDLVGVARKLSDEVSRPVLVGGAVVRVTASVGLAVHIAGEDAETLLTRADLAMYTARERATLGWELFDIPTS